MLLVSEQAKKKKAYDWRRSSGSKTQKLKKKKKKTHNTSNQASQKTFEQEEPEPTGVSTNAAHLQDTCCKQSRDDTGDIERRPKGGKTHGQLLGRVKVCREENGGRDEATLAEADQGPADQETGAVVLPGLRPGHGAPGHHQAGQDVLEAVPLGGQLYGELGREEEYDLDGGAVVVVVCRQAHVGEEAVGQRIGQVSAVELETKEHDAEPREKVHVRLAHHPALFLLGPRCRRVESVTALVALVGWKNLAEILAPDVDDLGMFNRRRRGQLVAVTGDGRAFGDHFLVRVGSHGS